MSLKYCLKCNSAKTPADVDENICNHCTAVVTYGTVQTLQKVSGDDSMVPLGTVVLWQKPLGESYPQGFEPININGGFGGNGVTYR